MLPHLGSEDPLRYLRTSRISERVMAHLIDLLIISAIYLPLITLVTFRISLESLLAYILILSAVPLVIVLYFTLLEGLTSTTVGKRLLNLKVISLNRMEGLSLAESFVRNLFRLSDMLTLYLPILILRGRRIGDALAGTAVVSRGFLRVELPMGDSPLSRELQEGIVKAVLLELNSSLERFDDGTLSPSIRERVAGVLRSHDDVTVDRVARFLSSPSLQMSLLGAEGIAKIYERAAEFCGGSGEILRNRAMIIRAFSSRRAGKVNLSSVFRETPLEFRGSAVHFLISIALFAASSLIAYHLRPGWVESLLREIFGRDLVPSGMDPFTLSCLVFLNNLRVVLATLGTAPLALMPFLTLAANGALVGLVASLRDPFEVALLILPHRIPELTSIFIATSLSMRILGELLRGEGRWFRARVAVMGSINLAIFSIFLLLYAAFVEGFLTRWLSNYPSLDIAFSLMEALAIYSYLLYGLRPSRGS